MAMNVSVEANVRCNVTIFLRIDGETFIPDCALPLITIFLLPLFLNRSMLCETGSWNEEVMHFF